MAELREKSAGFGQITEEADISAVYADIFEDVGPEKDTDAEQSETDTARDRSEVSGLKKESPATNVDTVCSKVSNSEVEPKINSAFTQGKGQNQLNCTSSLHVTISIFTLFYDF